MINEICENQEEGNQRAMTQRWQTLFGFKMKHSNENSMERSSQSSFGQMAILKSKTTHFNSGI